MVVVRRTDALPVQQEEARVTPPARLYFILARQAPVGVIFRRGPSKWVQLIRWNTETDTFEPGQWLHGRIYEKRCDLSPDGSLLIYFAQKINRRTMEDREYTYAWTAISKPPYLTALALWPKGDCWHGGGLFETNARVWLNHHPAAAVPHPDHVPQGLEVVPNPDACGEDDPVHFRRLERDGWVMRQEWQGHHDEGAMAQFFREMVARGLFPEEMTEQLFEQDLNMLTTGEGYVTEQPAILEKAAPSGEPLLVMEHGINRYTPTWRFSLRESATGATLALPGAAWADWDHRGRPVYAAEGKLFAGQWSPGQELDLRELADLNAPKPAPVEPPAWATTW
jgi:hypothetical protein